MQKRKKSKITKGDSSELLIRGLIILFSFALVINLASASFQLGSPLAELQNSYAPDSPLAGWINISFNSEPLNSLFSLNENTATIENIISSNAIVEGVDYTCSTNNCGSDYSILDNGEYSKQFTLNSGQSKIIGLKITGSTVSGIINFFLKMNSNVGDSCNSQLKIDFLNDGIIDWEQNQAANSYCGSKDYGCYSSPSNLISTDMSNNVNYCNQISMGKTSAILAGAELVGNGQARFRFSLDTGESCEKDVSTSGEISCSINTTIFEPRNITLCVSKVSGTGAYKIYAETNLPVCGNLDYYEADFSIFAQKKNYAAIGDKLFNSSWELDLDSLIESYISEKYNNNCSNGCFIPINITSNANQVITISNLSVAYNAGISSTQLIYTLKEEVAKITMPFTQIDLTNSDLKVPSAYGFYNISLKLKDTIILNKTIEVLNIPLITSLWPLEVPAAFNIIFNTFVTGGNITEYTWDFGDNSSDVTTSSNTEHRYSNMGIYLLNLTARNSYGVSTRTFLINVISPKNYISSAFDAYTSRVSNLKSQIGNFSSWIKEAIDDKLKITEAEIEIETLRNRYESVGDDSSADYIVILNSLQTISLPESIIMSSSTGNLMLEPGKLNIPDMASLDSSQIEISSSELTNAIVAWQIENIDVTTESIDYSVQDNGQTIPFASYFKLTLKPKQEIDKFYLLINKPSSNVITNSLNEKISLSSSTGFNIEFNGLEEQTIELLVYRSQGGAAVSVYTFPAISELQVAKICEVDDFCDEANGENSDNCPEDCKSTSHWVLWLILAILILLIGYILFQIFYNKKDVKSLFKGDVKKNIIDFFYWGKVEEKEIIFKQPVQQSNTTRPAMGAPFRSKPPMSNFRPNNFRPRPFPPVNLNKPDNQNINKPGQA